MRKFMVLGLGALSTLTLSLGAAAPAAHAAAPVDLGIVSSLCGVLPGNVVNIATSLLGATTALTTANIDSAAKQAALGTATTALVNAVVAHILNVNAGNDGGSTKGAVATAVGDYANASVNANTAFNKSVDAQRALNALSSSQAFAQGVAAGLC